MFDRNSFKQREFPTAFMSIVFVLLLFAGILMLTGCTLFPPEPQAVIETARSNGCTVKSVSANDSFNWRFLGFSTSRHTDIACHDKASGQ